MEEWKEIRLGDIVEVASGFAYKGEFIGSGSSRLLGMGCVSFKEKFLLSGARPYSGEAPNRFLAQPGDIVLATRQQSENLPILGMPAIIPDSLSGHNVIVGANLYRIINNSEIDNRFLYWQLKTPHYVDHINKCKTGTTVRMITKKNIEDYVFLCPPKEVREKIASMLWNLEDKIDLNTRINHNLEEQAQALYKSWFVDFEPFKDGKFVESELGMIPEGWKCVNLTNVSSIFDSMRKPLSGMQRENMKKLYPYYGATEIMDYVDNYIFDGIYLLMGEDGSVVKPNGDPYLQYIEGKFWPNNHAHVLQGANGYSTEMLHCALLHTNITHAVTGAVQAKISQANMKKILFILPPEDVCNAFDSVIQSIYKNKRRIEKENNALRNQRNIILPKLMSGEIDC